MVLGGGGAAGTIVKMRCPHCGEIQTRARPTPKTTHYVCRKCKERFTPEEGDAEARGANFEPSTAGPKRRPPRAR